MAELPDLIERLGDSLYKLWGIVEIGVDRFQHNFAESFNMMDTKKWIRLVIVVGAYMLLRPYILKTASRHQEKQMEKENEEAASNISPNQLRGQVDIPEDSDDDDEAGAGGDSATTATEWGKKARKRQRHMLKKLIEVEEKRLQDLQEDEEDKDIEQYLVG